jgi:hypothetical protein
MTALRLRSGDGKSCWRCESRLSSLRLVKVKLDLNLYRKPLTARDRAIRLEVHKMHVVSLLANAGVRNKWCSDDLLKVCPPNIIGSFPADFSVGSSAFVDASHYSRRFSHSAFQNTRCHSAIPSLHDSSAGSGYVVGQRFLPGLGLHHWHPDKKLG